MTLWLAIPRFGDEVAPRFCAADDFVLVEVDDGAVASRHSLSLAGVPWPERLSRLAARDVSVLLCGGFNRHYVPRATSLGIHVCWGLVGRADDLVVAYCRGDIERLRLCVGRGRPAGAPEGRRRPVGSRRPGENNRRGDER